MLRNISVLITSLVLSQQVFSAGLCESIFLMKDLRVHQKDQVQVLNNPERFLNRKLSFTKNSSIAGPLQIIRRNSLTKDLELVIQDLYILSRDSYLREVVFGSGSRQLSYKKMSRSPLKLNEESHGEDGTFVEVGVEVITTKKGQTFYIYSTSNDRSTVRTEYGHLASILETLQLTPNQIKSVDSFHTHPLNLFPSKADQHFFKQEASVLLSENPRLKEIPFEWNMHTAIEFQPYLHQVNVKDWLQ